MIQEQTQDNDQLRANQMAKRRERGSAPVDDKIPTSKYKLPEVENAPFENMLGMPAAMEVEVGTVVTADNGRQEIVWNCKSYDVYPIPIIGNKAGFYQGCIPPVIFCYALSKDDQGKYSFERAAEIYNTLTGRDGTDPTKPKKVGIVLEQEFNSLPALMAYELEPELDVEEELTLEFFEDDKERELRKIALKRENRDIRKSNEEAQKRDAANAMLELMYISMNRCGQVVSREELAAILDIPLFLEFCDKLFMVNRKMKERF